MLTAAKEAIRLDSSYADAWATAGAACLYPGIYIGKKELKDAVWDALPYIETTLGIDQNNSLAHLLKGHINEWGRLDYVTAEKEYTRVNELSPNTSSRALNLIQEFYLKMNQINRAIEVSEKTLEKGPGYFSSNFKVYFLNGNKRMAISYLDSLRSLRSYKGIAEALIWLESYDSAKYYFESAIRAVDSSMLFPRYQARLALTYFNTGQKQRSREIIEHLKEKSKVSSSGSPEYYLGWYYSATNEKDSAFKWLERQIIQKAPNYHG